MTRSGDITPQAQDWAVMRGTVLEKLAQGERDRGELRAQVAALQRDMDMKHAENRGDAISLKSRLDLFQSEVTAKVAALATRMTVWGTLSTAIPTLAVIGFEVWRIVK